ncbi:MAG: hypothetical protein ACK2U5_04360, partial [Candidatus Promineifilaceae bacterium]
ISNSDVKIYLLKLQQEITIVIIATNSTIAYLSSRKIQERVGSCQGFVKMASWKCSRFASGVLLRRRAKVCAATDTIKA